MLSVWTILRKTLAELSVTRLGDLLDFGQVLALGNN